MTGIGINVLVRFLAGDDWGQANRIDQSDKPGPKQSASSFGRHGKPESRVSLFFFYRLSSSPTPSSGLAPRAARYHRLTSSRPPGPTPAQEIKMTPIANPCRINAVEKNCETKPT